MRRVVVNLATMTAAQQAGTASVVHGPGCVTWHSTYETTGAASATYSLADGGSTNGINLMYVTLSAAQSTRDSLVLHSLPFVESLHYTQVSGSVGGVLVAWVDHICEEELDLHHALARLQVGVDLERLVR